MSVINQDTDAAVASANAVGRLLPGGLTAGPPI